MVFFFIIISYPYFLVNGVFGDEVKSVSVMEGQNVTLHTDDELHTHDVIVWYYRPKNTIVAIINWEARSTKLSDDERFRDRLEVNNQTGDLTISDVKSTESGLYTLMISRKNEISNKNFNLTVNGRLPVLPLNHITKHTQEDNTQLCHDCSESPAKRVHVITIVVAFVFCVIMIIIIIISIIIVYMKKRKAVPVKSSEGENCLTDEKEAAHLKTKTLQSV